MWPRPKHDADTPLAVPVNAELRRGEIVRWSGRPEGPPPILTLLVGGLFALVWMGFSLVWESSALYFFWDSWFGAGVTNTPRVVSLIMAVFGLPFVAVGLGMLAYPLLAARRRRNTIFVVTNQRLMRLNLARVASVESIEARQIFQTVRKDRANGFGDVEVLRSTATDSDGHLIEAKFTLDGLHDARGAEKALAELARQRSDRTT